eukprot:TRINITY_DN1891_c0_g1_i1.p1 TRINITY_DN1891_c0_g1~~TRINITY_DN1891_c0_g1_i1.p1  ORF type:complete len:504 (+),score=172.11 TRINITY_DN1891_c0_g1_i1:1588-3099(+)
MFYEQMVLAKKGPLGHVWLAAHWEKKVTKAQVQDTEILDTVDRIQNPRAPMALRLSGHLLLGVVRIYHRQVDYLYADCQEALVKIKMAFRPGTVDLEETVANLHSITLPATATSNQFEVVLPGELQTQSLPDVEEGLFTLNLARAKDITMHDDTEMMRAGEENLDFALPEDDMGLEMSLSEGVDLLASRGPEEDFEPIEEEDLLRGEFSQAEELPEEAGFEQNRLEDEGWADIEVSEISSEAPGLAIDTMPERDPAPRLRKKRYAVDTRTELSQAAIKRSVANASTTLRTLTRAPGTRELMELSYRQEQEGALSYFQSPNMKGLASNLTELISRTMATKEEFEMPSQPLEESGVSSIEGERAGEAATSFGDVAEDFYPEEGFGGDMDAELPPSVSLPAEDVVSESEVDELADAAPTGGADSHDLVVTKRTAAMHQFLNKKFEASQSTSLQFQDLFGDKKKRTVAIAFFELLSIASKDCVSVKQKEPFANITVTKTSTFNSLTA